MGIVQYLITFLMNTVGKQNILIFQQLKIYFYFHESRSIVLLGKINNPS